MTICLLIAPEKLHQRSAVWQGDGGLAGTRPHTQAHPPCAHEPGSHFGWRQALEALGELQLLGCRFVIFEGGEPLLWRYGGGNFSDLAEQAHSMFRKNGVSTNGSVPALHPGALYAGWRILFSKLRND